LTLLDFRRALVSTMSAGLDAIFARVKELVADFRANEKFHLSPACQETNPNEAEMFIRVKVRYRSRLNESACFRSRNKRFP
jgi:hypothetical protein